MNERTIKSSSEKCVILKSFGSKCRKGYNNLSCLSACVFTCALVQCIESWREKEREKERQEIVLDLMEKWLIKMCKMIWVAFHSLPPLNLADVTQTEWLKIKKNKIINDGKQLERRGEAKKVDLMPSIFRRLVLTKNISWKFHE